MEGLSRRNRLTNKMERTLLFCYCLRLRQFEFMFQSDTRWQHAVSKGPLLGAALSLFPRTEKCHDLDMTRIDPAVSDEIPIS